MRLTRNAKKNTGEGGRDSKEEDAKDKGLKKELKDRVTRNLERTKKVEVKKVKEHLMEPIHDYNQPIKTEEKDWGEDDMDDAVEVMENKQEEVLTLQCSQ